MMNGNQMPGVDGTAPMQPAQTPPNLMDQNLVPQEEVKQQEDTEVSPSRIPAKLRGFIQSKNIAESLGDEKLKKIGAIVCKNAKVDDQSRDAWKNKMGKALEIAKQVYTKKTYPWSGAANIKYPLLLTACMQFNSRSFPNIIQNNQVVFVDIMKPEPTPQEEESAERIGNHMSYQLIGKNDNWLNDKDKLLMILPLTGIVFTKTYFNEIDKNPVTDLCLPQDIIVNQNAKNLDSAQRITHVLYFNNNDIISRMRSGLFLDIPLEELIEDDDENRNLSITEENNETTDEDIEELHDNESQEHVMYEQHCFFDLDNDGYAEPYIVTVHTSSQKVLRIVARYNYSDFVFDDDKKKNKEFVKINPIQSFTDYRLMHSPDGDFYGMGFGQILYPLNEAVNTIFNQLVDAGTLSNQQSGFIGKSMRIRKEDTKLRPGEWKLIDTAGGTNMSQNIVPLPTKEPSGVLFQLLGMLIEATQSVANVSDVMQGQMPPANTPATTVVSLIEQGTKIFSAILLRLHNSLKSEYNKLYQLNRKYLTEQTSYRSAIGSGFITPEDYTQNDFGIFPVADPRESIEAQSLARAQALMQILGNPAVNQREILTRYLEALKIPNIDKILPEPDPKAPPPPEAQKIMEETELTKAKIAEVYANIGQDAIKLDLEEKQLLINGEQVASSSASQKVASIAEMTQLEQEANRQEIDQATQMTEKLTTDITPQISDLQNRINLIEQQAGVPSQAPQGQPQAPTGGAAQPGEQGSEPNLEGGMAPGAESAPEQPEPEPE